MTRRYGTGISGPRKTTPWKREGDVERRTGPYGVETRCPECKRTESGYGVWHYLKCSGYAKENA